MSPENSIENFLSVHTRRQEKITLKAAGIAIGKAGIAIIDAVRVSNFCTNVYLEGGGILCVYDSGRLVLQGKPTAAEIRLVNSIVNQSESNAPATKKHDLEEWEEWRAAQYSGSKK